MNANRNSVRYLGAILVVAVTTSLTVASAALADVGLGLHFGYAKARDADSGDGLVGGHLEIRPVRIFGIQGAVDYRSVSQYDVTVGPVDGSLDVRSVPVTLTGRLYIPVGVTSSLFAGAGAGWYHLIYDYSNDLEAIGVDDRSESTFGWHVGGGLDIGIAPRVSLFGEGRAVFVDPDRALDGDTLDQAEDFDYDSTYFAGGLTVHF
jgi:opacity protein-like surface antigen